MRPAKRLCSALLGAALMSAACGDDGPPRRDILGAEKKLYSQFDEELIIRDYFQDRRDGFFLDIGAADPVVNNTTYYLEQHLGWRGIGVDAINDYNAAWQLQRPRSRFFNYLVTDHSGTLDAFYRAEERALSSTQKGRMWGPYQLSAQEIQVPSITLTKLLEDQKVERIDLLSMDIEESEPAALAGFDIARFRPQLVCIEVVERIKPQLHAYFEAHGYRRIDRYMERDAINWYYEPATAE